MAQEKQGAPPADPRDRTLYQKLSRDTNDGGPAPKRDLSGMWAGSIEPTMNKDIPPLTPLGMKLMSLNKPEANYGTVGTNDPWFTTCDPLGFPRSVINQTNITAFGTMPGKILILDGFNRVWREVEMDGRPLPKGVGTADGPDPRWFGYSAGHWENDNTLVVRSTGSDARSWVDKEGHPHSVDAVVEERYVRANHNNLQVTITLDDPKIFTKSYTVATNQFRWIPDQEFEEQICVPSEGIQYQRVIAVPAGENDQK
jgi:hypothetical protein